VNPRGRFDARGLLRRGLGALVVVWIVVSTVFAVVHLAPRDARSWLDDPRVPETQRARIREIYGVDDALAVRYSRWMSAVLRGDFGLSVTHQEPVASVMRRALPPTLLLGGSALGLGAVLGVLAGGRAARRAGGRFDRAVRFLAVLAQSTPTFWFGLVLILGFAVRIRAFPTSGLRGSGSSPGDGGVFDVARHLVLPCLVLALPMAASTARLLRAKLLDVLGLDFIFAARARGLSEATIYWRHALPNAIGPVIQGLALELPLLVSGSIATEVVFAWPGLGRVAYDALQGRDLPLAVATTLLSTTLVVAGTFLADVIAARVDPRGATRGPA
jgi:peptide/nickel transport system permease protein